MKDAKRPETKRLRPEVVVIGGSAGGLSALKIVLTSLPAGFSLPIVCVQHIKPDPDLNLAGVFSRIGPLHAVEVNDKQLMERGSFYIAPPNYHILIERDARISVSVDEPVNFSRPSIDVLFESAAYALGPKVIGVILTGASKDGAAGLMQIHRHGGLTIAQDPETAEATYMPRAAIATNHVDKILPLEEIGPFLAQVAEQEQKNSQQATGRRPWR